MYVGFKEVKLFMLEFEASYLPFDVEARRTLNLKVGGSSLASAVVLFSLTETLPHLVSPHPGV